MAYGTPVRGLVQSLAALLRLPRATAIAGAQRLARNCTRLAHKRTIRHQRLRTPAHHYFPSIFRRQFTV